MIGHCDKTIAMLSNSDLLVAYIEFQNQRSNAEISSEIENQ
jgi:hypothetical protein